MASLRTVGRFTCITAVIVAAGVSLSTFAQLKSSGGEMESRPDRKNDSGPMQVGRLRDRGPGLMGRVAWGQTGALRLVLLRWPPPGERADRMLRVRIVNEGDQTFTVQPSDTWAVRTEKGTAISATRKGASPDES